MHETGVKDEGFRLAEGVDRRVQEAGEKGGVELHRAGRVEQQHEAERAKLAPPPDEIDRGSAVGDAAVDGAPEIEPRARPAGSPSPHQPRPHAPGEPLGERMNLRHLLRVGDMADVAARQRLGRRGRVATVAAARPAAGLVVAVAAFLAAIRGLRRETGGQGFAPGRTCGARAAQRLDAAHAGPAPERVEQLVEAPPVLARRREQRAERRFQQGGSPAGGRGENGERVSALGEPDREAVGAQDAGEGGDPRRGLRA